jgi:pimeloyl-ACP methyl ester carboxylesterase
MKIIDGEYYLAGEKNLFARVSGNSAPVIVIESGFGGLAVEWSLIQDELSKHATVITYDRAGYAESPKGSKPRSSRKIASELRQMLHNAYAKPPFILVGFAFGGYCMQQFARLFPDDCAALVLIDSFSEDFHELSALDTPKYQELASFETRINNIRGICDIEEIEFEEYITPILDNLYKGLDVELYSQLMAYQSDKRYYETIVDEFDAFCKEIVENPPEGKFPNIPLKVLTHDYENMIEISESIGVPRDEARLVEDKWLELGKKIASKSTESELKIVRSSSHFIYLTQPQAVIDEILEVINK